MSDLQRHQHCYDYAELEAERDRLDKEVDTLTTAAYAANEKNWALRKENDRLQHELKDAWAVNYGLREDAEQWRKMVRTHLNTVPDHECKYEKYDPTEVPFA